MPDYGLTSQGFVPKQQSVIKSEIEGELQALFGQSVNLLPVSVFGQLVGIFSGREANIWQLAEAVYSSQYPSGAEGTSVDNILALSNMKRLPATPSVTAPMTSGIPGLLFLGDEATLIPAGTLISVFGQPTFQFSVDSDVIIAAAVNEIQNILFSSVPNAGTWKISIGLLETSALAFNAGAAAIQTALRLLAGYGDVTVTGDYVVGFTVNFLGASGAQDQPLMTIEDSTLMTGMLVVNTQVIEAQVGAPSQGIGSATATQNGPIPAPAGTLTVIDTPVSGWDSVTNPLDVIPGTNIETDTEAMERRSLLLAAQGNGPLQSIVQKVLLLPNVLQAVGFENRGNAAQQVITFDAIPDSGAYRLFIKGIATASLAYNATAATLQTQLRANPSFPGALVSGDYQFGFTVDFNGGDGGQPQDLIQVISNTLLDGATPVTTEVAYGLPAHAFEVVAVGGEEPAIADAIFDSKPAGIETYGNVEEIVVDGSGNPYPIRFSRPSTPPVYISINLQVDQDTFPADGVTQIQNELVAIGDAIPIGGLIAGFGTNGLIGAFNNIEGVVFYELFFGLSPNPLSNDNIQLLPQQRGLFETFNVLVTVSYV